MRKIFIAPIAISLITVAATASASSARTPEDSLAAVVACRTAGAEVSCLDLDQIRDSHIIDGTAIVYAGANGTLYVNRPASGAASLRDGLILVMDTHIPELCSVDSVMLYDGGARMDAGSVGLGMFTPYPRNGASARN